MFNRNEIHLTSRCEEGAGPPDWLSWTVALHDQSMSQEELKKECAKAFFEKNKQDAERLLPQIRQPAKVRVVKEQFTTSSLLHLAARHGWLDVVTELATKYKCDVNCKDDEGATPLYWAAMYCQLEVMKYLINEHHCDPMTKDIDPTSLGL